jgi:hypothetical protein
MTDKIEIFIAEVRNAATGAEITGGIKAIVGLATMFINPAGAVADVVGGAAKSAIGDPTGIGGLYTDARRPDTDRIALLMARVSERNRPILSGAG